MNSLSIIPWQIWMVLLSSLVTLGMAYYFARYVIRQNPGNSRMQEIASFVIEGAIAFLKQQYRVISVLYLILTAIFAVMAYGLGIQNPWVPFAFLTGGFFSGLAGYIGMRIATLASSRVAQACRSSLNNGLIIAFRAGAVMGLTVTGLALLDISIWFIILKLVTNDNLITITTTMLTFGFGASLQAVFARVGGGIFTKAADVGADLAGKVEAGIPEDSPDNPATVADNVGDNVGDVAGMGADLYESFVGSILATAGLGAATFLLLPEEIQINAVIAPMLIAAVGNLMSIVSIFFVKTKENATQKDLLSSLSYGINASSILIAFVSIPILYSLDIPFWFGKWGAMMIGLISGILIGKSTEYFTSGAYSPVKNISKASATGPATVIISGLGSGMISTVIPVIVVGVATILAFLFSTNFNSENLNEGLYGIGLAAVGMLSTLGITLATDAYGPIADNAGGNAEMSGLPPEVRKRTDALDSLGNTTAATGKGLAIGSAALTALALVASIIEQLRIEMLRQGFETLLLNGREILVKDASLIDFMIFFNVTLINPYVLIGLFLGVMLSFLFSGLTILSVGKAAEEMVEEVRRQFREIKGILTGEAKPDYARCVLISTKSAQREMILPCMSAVAAPLITGLVLGIAGVFGLVVGCAASGFVLAIFQANTGGALDNAKKHVEEGNLGGKGSDAHKATVIGDTIGDPLKDTSGPALNILIKLMAMVAIIFAGLFVYMSM